MAMCVQAPAAVQSSPAVYVKKETQYAWECIQKECQKLLGLLLQGQTGTAPAGMQTEKLGQSSVASSSLPFSVQASNGGQGDVQP